MEERTTFLEILSENFVKYADRIALSSSIDNKGCTYHELDLLSGQVYSYLSRNGIGPEDFVMINMPRGSSTFAICVGVWRAGAAFTICEEGYPQEKIDYIYDDCKCKIKFTQELFQELMAEPYKAGYVKCDEHAAAYAGYTSGTTGNPKGIIHEIGTLINCRKSHVCDGKKIFTCDDVLGLIAPLNFAAAIMQMNPVLCAGGQVAIASYEYAKNPVKLEEYFKAKNVTVGFLTPSLVHIFKKLPDSIRVLFLSSEPACNICFDNIEVYNMYAQTETGCVCAAFRVDKPYVITPIGRSQIPELDLQVLDENNNKCRPGEMGELCFENRFFREYIGLPKMTTNAKRGGIYHTGDIGKYLPDGNIILLGRNDDMVKINGNRVEPAEVEKVVKEALQVKWAAAKVIKTETRAFICAYYNGKLTVDLEAAKKVIAEKLPAYMVPSYYMYIDKIPMNANGKFSRKDLPVPNTSNIAKKAYAAPENEIQKLLTEAFEEVLGLEQVGIDEDFYELGGDSVYSMEVTAQLPQLNISVSDIFKGRTVREIDRILSEKRTIEYTEEKNAEALKIPHRLTPFQMYIFDCQMRTPNSTMWNLPVFIRTRNDVRGGKIKNIIPALMKTHPALRTKIKFDENENLVQYYDDSEPVVEVEEVTEEEMIDIREELIRPFKMIESPLFRVRIFKTERNIYAFMDIHHIIADGTSLHVLMSDYGNVIRGKELKKDFYYVLLEEKEMTNTTKQFLEDKEYYQKLYDGTTWTVHPETDFDDRSNKAFSIEADIPVYDDDCRKLIDKYGVSDNAFFMAVALLTLAKFCNARNVMLTWTFSGRDEANKQNIVGSLIYDLPVGVRLTDDMTVYDVMQEVKKQISGGMSHTAYPYTFLEGDRAGLTDITCFLYQHNIFDIRGLVHRDFDIIKLSSHYDAADNLLNIEIIDNDNDNRKILSIEYESSRYKEETMHQLRRVFQKIVARLVQYADRDDLTVNDIIK